MFLAPPLYPTLEAKVIALRALHAKLRDLDAGESFGDIVARGRPKSEML